MPGEANNEGLYIHRVTDKMPGGTRTITLTQNDEAQEWVHADDFMAVQKERDDYRRTLALVNAWRWGPAHGSWSPLDRLLRNAGLSPEDGHAMLSLIESVKGQS